MQPKAKANKKNKKIKEEERRRKGIEFLDVVVARIVEFNFQFDCVGGYIDISFE